MGIEDNKATIRRIFDSMTYSIVLGVIVLVASVLIAYEFLFAERLSEDAQWLLLEIDFFVSFLFLIDYAVGLWLARKKKKYVFSWAGALNLLSSVPFPQGTLQFLRVLKLLRASRGIRIAMQGQSLYLRHKKQKQKITREFTADGLAEHNAGTLHVENEP